MFSKFEQLVKAMYKRYKQEIPLPTEHPDEEALALFSENKLSTAEAQEIKEHLLSCSRCAEALSMQIKMKIDEGLEVPVELLDKVKGLLPQEARVPFLEMFLRLKGAALEILSTTGDVLVGQELVPAPVLRSRNIQEFKDEVTILKDFPDIRAEIKIENKKEEAFSLSILIKEKATQKIMKDLRVTLIKDALEIESYLSESGRVIFEHILLGQYTVEVSTLDKKLATILLDIKV